MLLFLFKNSYDSSVSSFWSAQCARRLAGVTIHDVTLFLECVGPLSLVCKLGFAVVWSVTLVFVSLVAALVAWVVMSNQPKLLLSFHLYWYVVFCFFLIKYMCIHILKKSSV
jgi:hypothetical protein